MRLSIFQFLNLSFALVFLNSCALSLNNETSTEADTYFIKQWGSTNYSGAASETEYVAGTVIDDDGNVIIVGRSQGDLFETNGGTGTDEDVIVIKTSKNGDVIWEKQIGAVTGPAFGLDTSGNDRSVNVATDGQNIYVAGFTDGNFGETNGGGYDTFVFKMNSLGELQWFRQFGATTEASSSVIADTSGNDFIQSILIDRQGQVVLAGHSGGDFLESGSAYDIVVLKLSADDGTLVDAVHFGDVTAAGYGLNNAVTDQVTDITEDASGNYLISGLTTGSFIETNAGGADAVIMKLDVNLDYMAGKQFGNVSQPSGADQNDSGYRVRVDSSGNIFMGIQTAGDFAETNAGSATEDVGLVKMDSSFNVIWAKQLGQASQPSADNIDRPRGLELDVNGNAIIAIYTYSDLAETNGDGITPDRDIAFVKFNSSGNHIWTRHFGQETMTARGANADYEDMVSNSISIDSNGNIYSAGWTKSDFGEPNADSTHSTFDLYLIKLNADGLIE